MPHNEPLRFSLSQMIAAMAVFLALPTLFRVLLWPPIGRTGLTGALLAMLVLFAGLWFCRRDLKARLVTVAIGGWLIGLIWFVFWLDHGLGLLFGSHASCTPEPWIIIATISAVVGLLAGWRWWVNQKFSQPVSRLSSMMILVLMLSSSSVALVGAIRMPNAIRQLDEYSANNVWVATPGVLTVKARRRPLSEVVAYLRQPGVSNRIAVIESIYTWHANAALLPDLIDLLSDDNAEVRRTTAHTLDHWAENRLKQPAAGSKEELTSAVHVLVIGLNHEDATVRQYAARFLDDPYFFDPAGYASLPTSTIPALIQASQRSEENVRNRARIILKSVERAQKFDPATQ